MWILFAFGSAFFAGLTAILAKVGVKRGDSNVATAIRTTVILVFAWIMVLITKGYKSEVTIKSLVFLVLSGGATGLSWIFYFKALQLGDVNKVTPIDKSSTVLTMVLAIIFLGERLSVEKGLGMIFIGIGTYMMIARKREISEKRLKGEKYEMKETRESLPQDRRWVYYAIFSVFFSSLTSILGKVGVTGIESNYGTAIRTAVVFVMAWIVVFMLGKQEELKKIKGETWIFLCLSGVTTGLSWFSYYRALQEGEASLVVPIDKLSILITILFSYVVLKERITKKAFVGLVGIVIGTLLMLF